MELIIGTKYEIETKNKEKRTGVLVTKNKDTIFIKLKSGYNEGIKIKNIENTKKIKEPPIKPKKTQIIENNPEILILHTGGTIASKIDYATGAVTSLTTPEEILKLYPELKEEARIGSELISNMPSDDLNFSHYNQITKKIDEAIKKYPGLKGIILTHGTDTMHYTSNALSFTIQNPPIPIIIVGSQRSSDRPSSDAALNLLSATRFITKKPEYKEIMICMHETTNDANCTIFKGLNVRKTHTTRRDTFKQINTEPIARINYEKNEINTIQKPTKKEEKLKITHFNEELKIGWIKTRPGIPIDEFDKYTGFDAIILEGTGLGHFPITEFDEKTKINTKIYKKLKELSKKTILAMTTQTTQGRVNLNVYSPARKLKELGVLGHNIAMMQETAYIKLAWLLSNYKKEDIPQKYEEDITGEQVNRIKGELK